jgi:hypothetical protein
VDSSPLHSGVTTSKVADIRGNILAASQFFQSGVMLNLTL